MKKRNVILDCDPGHDDAFAMYILLAADNIDLKAVTTASGNQTQEKVYSNAVKLLALANRQDIPVAKGFVKPMKRDLVVALDIHGESGIDGAILPDIEVKEPEMKAIDLMAKVIKESDEPVTIVATGPLTNVAIFLLAYPELHHKIELISFMGGACFGGNWSSTAEFNVYVDPDATSVVVDSKIPTAMFGLDVTLKAEFFDEDIEKVRAIDSDIGRNFVGILEFFSTKIAQPFLAPEGHIEGQHLHDACAAAYIVHPEMFTMASLNVEVNTNDGMNYAQTVVDYNKKSGREENVLVGFDLDRPAFVELILQSLKKLSGEKI